MHSGRPQAIKLATMLTVKIFYFIAHLYIYLAIIHTYILGGVHVCMCIYIVGCNISTPTKKSPASVRKLT